MLLRLLVKGKCYRSVIFQSIQKVPAEIFPIGNFDDLRTCPYLRRGVFKDGSYSDSNLKWLGFRIHHGPPAEIKRDRLSIFPKKSW